MPLRGPGFNQPVTTAVLSVAAVAYMLWILFAEDTEETEKKSEKKTEDVPRPREPRTILLPKLSLRDFRNDEYLYGEDGEYETIVLEQWVDKYDGPSSAYSRRSFPTESHSWPTVAPPYRPAAPQPRSRKPDRRPPVKGPSTTRSTCSIFGDGDLFSAIRGMGDFNREKPAAAAIVHRGESAEFLRRVRAAKIKVEVDNISRHSKENEDEILKRAVKVQEDGPISLRSEQTDEEYWDAQGFQDKFLIKRAEDKIRADSRHSEEGSIYVYVNGPWLPLWRVEYNEFYNPNPPAWLAEDVEDGDPFFDALDVPIQDVHSESGSIYVNGPWLPLWRVDYDEFYNPNPPAWLAEDTEDPFFDALDVPVQDVPPAWLAKDTGDEEPFFDALDVPVQLVPLSAVKGKQLGPVQELERPHQLLMTLIMFVMMQYLVSFQILMSSGAEKIVDAMTSVFAVIRIYYDKIKQLILPFIPSIVKDVIISASGRTWMWMTTVAESVGGAMNRALALLQIHSDKFQLVANKIKQLLQPLVPYVMMFKDSLVSMLGSARMRMASLGGAMNRALLLNYVRFQVVVLLSYDRFQVVVSKIKQLLNALIPPVIQECMVSFYGSIRIRITSVAELLAGAMNMASPFVIKFKECILSIFGCIWILMISMIELLAGAMHRTMLVLHYAITDLMYPRLKQLVLAFIAFVIKFIECILSIYGYARILIIKLVETLWGAVKRLLRVLHYVGYDLMYTSVKRLVQAFIASVIRLKDRIISCILFILIIIYLTRRAYQHRNQLRHRMN